MDAIRSIGRWAYPVANLRESVSSVALQLQIVSPNSLFHYNMARPASCIVARSGGSTRSPSGRAHQLSAEDTPCAQISCAVGLHRIDADERCGRSPIISPGRRYHFSRTGQPEFRHRTAARVGSLYDELAQGRRRMRQYTSR